MCSMSRVLFTVHSVVITKFHRKLLHSMIGITNCENYCKVKGRHFVKIMSFSLEVCLINFSKFTAHLIPCTKETVKRALLCLWNVKYRIMYNNCYYKNCSNLADFRRHRGIKNVRKMKENLVPIKY